MKKKHDYEGISHSFRVSEQNTQKLETRSLLMILHITSIFVPSKYETVAVLPKIWGVQTLLHYLSINKKFNAKNCILILQRKRVLRDPRNCIWQVIPQFSSMELVQPKKKTTTNFWISLICFVQCFQTNYAEAACYTNHDLDQLGLHNSTSTSSLQSNRGKYD